MRLTGSTYLEVCGAILFGFGMDSMDMAFTGTLSLSTSISRLGVSCLEELDKPRWAQYVVSSGGRF